MKRNCNFKNLLLALLSVKFLLITVPVCSAKAGPEMEGPGQFRIISDIDDTVKLAHSGSVWGTFYYGLFTDRVYPGMDFLYRELLHPTATQPDLNSKGAQRLKTPPFLFFVTNSPTILTLLRTKFLNKFQFPPHGLFLRNYFIHSSAVSYKKVTLKRLLETFQEPVILIGDDTKSDSKAYAAVQREFPQRVLEIYIRQVVGGKVSKLQKIFTNAFDLALMEFKAGRLRAEQVIRIGTQMLKEKFREDLHPSFVFCPNRFKTSFKSVLALPKFMKKSWFPQLSQIEKELHKHIQSICSIKR